MLEKLKIFIYIEALLSIIYLYKTSQFNSLETEMTSMPEITLIKSPWEDIFLDLVEQTEENLRITSPFIKSKPVEKMISAKRVDVSIEYITSFKLMNFYRKSSDFEALNTILRNDGIIKNYQPLHAKMYIFDQKQAIITSGNLTDGGMNTNYEYGVLIKDETNVASVMHDFYSLFNSNITGNISFEILENAQKIIQDTPREKEVTFKPLEAEVDENDIFDVGKGPITGNLTGWKLEVFNCLDSIESKTFLLNEAYVFEDVLSKKYPDNSNIRDKIRQQLQYLRDLGLIEFKGRGVYRKLWK